MEDRSKATGSAEGDAADLPAALGGRPTPLPPAPKTLQPKRKTLQLFGVLERPPVAQPAAPKPSRPSVAPEPNRRPTPAATTRAKTPFARDAARLGAHERVQGPPPADPSAVASTLEPLIAWMEEDRRPEFFRQIIRGEFDGAMRLLAKQKERYPRNLTIGKALSVVEDAAASQLLHEVGFPHFEVVVTSEPARVRPGSPLSTMLKIARSSTTLGEVLERAPGGKLRTLELIKDLMGDGTMVVRPPPHKRVKSGFGRGGLSTPAFDPSRDSSPDRELDGDEDLALASRKPTRLVEPETSRATMPDPDEVAAKLAIMNDLPASLRSSSLRALTPPPSDPPGRASGGASEPQAPAKRQPEAERPSLDALLAAIEPAPPTPPSPSATIETPPVPLTVSQAIAELDSLAGRAAPRGLDVDDQGEHDADSLPIVLSPPRAVPRTEPGAARVERKQDVEPSEPPAKSSDPPAVEARSDRKDELHTTIRSRTLAPAAEEPEKKGPSLLLITTGLAGLAALVSVVSLVVVMTRPSPTPSEPAAPVVKTVVVTASPPVATAPPTSTPGPKDTTNAATMVLEIEVTPKYAQVYLDGVLLPQPIKQTLQRDGKSHELRIEAGGYKPLKKAFDAKGDAQFVLSLEPRAGKATAAPAGGTYDE